MNTNTTALEGYQKSFLTRSLEEVASALEGLILVINSLPVYIFSDMYRYTIGLQSTQTSSKSFKVQNRLYLYS